jgi:hypothetical protein
MTVFWAFLYRLQDNYLWLLGLLFMVEPALDYYFESYRDWADRYLSRKLRTRLSIGLSLVAVFFACFMAFRDQYNATIEANNEKQIAIGERDEARRQAGERTTQPSAALILKKYVCTTSITAKNADHYAKLFEFGVKGLATSGFATVIVIDQPISSEMTWEAGPLRTDMPATLKSGLKILMTCSTASMDAAS